MQTTKTYASVRIPLPPGIEEPSRRYYVETWEGDRWVSENYTTRGVALARLAAIGRSGSGIYARVRARLNDDRTLLVTP